MKSFFYPESIVIFGVSSNPKNLGRVIVENLDRFNFKGDVFLIGDKDVEIMGRRVYKSINDVNVTPELAIFLIPASGIPSALEDCGKKGVKRVIIESGGFTELDENKRELEKEIIEIAHKWDMKIIGPNCVGVINVAEGVVLPFYPLHPNYVKNGPISLISQSGGLIHDIILLSSCENVGIGKLVSIGNKLILHENDFLEFFITDTDTKIIGMYLEGIQDGRRFMDLAARTDKPIILLKSNITPSGQTIAKFHTTALAGDDEVLKAALKQTSIHRVYSIQELIECFKIFLLPIIRGQRLAVMSRSGGHAVLAADATYRYGFKLAKLSDRFLKKVREKSRAGVINFTNPLDLGDVFDIEFYGEMVRDLLKEKDIDGLVIVHPWDLETEIEATKNFIKKANEASKEYGKPIIFCLISDKENWFVMKSIDNFPLFTDVGQALKMLSKSYEHFIYHEKASQKTIKTFLLKETKVFKTTGHKFMPPHEVFKMLSLYKIPVAEYLEVNSLRKAMEAAKNMGYPVVLKTASAEVLHKTEKGGVILNILNDNELKNAYRKIGIKSVIVQKMYRQGIEVIIGGKHDPNFGPVILLGLGGIFTEIFKTTSIRVAPIDDKTADEMIEEVKGAELLKGFRNQTEADKKALIDVLVNVSRLITEHPEVTTIDINPLIIFEKGKGCIVVDAKAALSSN
ncbi:MAG: acetate--CoA ligase family protein [Syntrophorhabdaceae bacterium]|nr:acetate--CoA ligase family protein [Syntrophorhabdaceae bacterium]